LSKIERLVGGTQDNVGILDGLAVRSGFLGLEL
jgi:hypothetical protein